jgi:hypothetical protein
MTATRTERLHAWSISVADAARQLAASGELTRAMLQSRGKRMIPNAEPA